MTEAIILTRRSTPVRVRPLYDAYGVVTNFTDAAPAAQGGRE